MIADSKMNLGSFIFTVERAEFCPIDCGPQPVMWDFNIYGHCLNDNDDRPLFPSGMMLSAQAIPLTLSASDDYTGFALRTPIAAYPDSGQSYFALWIGGEYETWDVDLRILEKRGSLYLLQFQAMTSFALENGHEQLQISAWAEEKLPRARPKTDYAIWLRPSLSERKRAGKQ